MHAILNNFDFSSSLKSKMYSLFLALLFLPVFAVAEEIIGHVVGVADGDTLTILVSGHDQIKVRLAEIDAPEKLQPFGQRSRQSLSDMCFDKEAVLQTTATDRYGRTVAKVTCAGVYANGEQIRVGLAWVYRKYLHDKSLLALENKAKVAKRGLWSNNDPVAPWEFRKLKRSGT